MDKCGLIPVDGFDDDEDGFSPEEEFYCETCGEYVNGPCNDDDE